MGTVADQSEVYRELASQRSRQAPDGFKQPEDFGYDFREWISPYTKGANRPNGIALVLQDWASEDGLKVGWNSEIARLGRNPKIKTNKVLEVLLQRVLDVSLTDVYATNAFPFVKPGGMSSPISQKLVDSTVRTFLLRELEIASPRVVLALGNVAHESLRRAGISSIHVPHPAARIGSIAVHENRWRCALSGVEPLQ